MDFFYFKKFNFLLNKRIMNDIISLNKKDRKDILMNNSSQIPEEFYYEELSKYLLSITNNAQKGVTGKSIDNKSASIIENRFINKLKAKNISSSDCLQTLYAIRLRRNAKTRNPLTKSEVKSNLIDKLVQRYHASRFCPPFQNELSTASSIKSDFPPLSELALNSKQLEGKVLPFADDDPKVHSIQKLFLDYYQGELSRSSSFLSKHPFKRIRTFKKVQKALRYHDKEGFIKKAKLALIPTVAASALALGIHIFSPNPNGVTIEQPIETSEELDSFKKSATSNQKIDESINQIYSDPSKLQYLGFSEDVTRNFEKYVMYNDNDALTLEQKEEFEDISRSLVKSFNIHELQKSTELGSSNIQNYSVSSNGLDYTAINYSTPSEEPNNPSMHSITVSPDTNIVKSNNLIQEGNFSSAVLLALRGSLCTLESNPETGYYEKADETVLDKVTSDISNLSQDLSRSGIDEPEL